MHLPVVCMFGVLIWNEPTGRRIPPACPHSRADRRPNNYLTFAILPIFFLGRRFRMVREFSCFHPRLPFTDGIGRKRLSKVRVG